ncbi:hypothetical protein GQ53DRAFT_5022 [Thozetella sp. PMI_491]|nr:hypothetical protein GQ53DRAFT_5022 [Thozetella sp. PMI_491]
MPGVPSGRGCEACRRQKKKCDQSQPSCSRCTRLRIACVGCGERRYKFLGATQVDFTSSRARGQRTQPVSRPPSNDMTLAASGFVAALQVTDSRFDLMVFGRFVGDIPRRLGTNEALDASVVALAAAMPSVYTHSETPQMYNAYANALKALRVSLSDPVKARSADTLVAMYLTGICQDWIGRQEDNFSSHGVAMAHMLNIGSATQWYGNFESETVTSLALIVLMESWIKPEIRLDRRIWDRPESFGPRRLGEMAKRYTWLNLRNFATMADFIREPGQHLPEIKSAYEEIKDDLRRLRAVLDKFPPSPQLLADRRAHITHQVACAILLQMVFMVNAILCAYDPANVSLGEECAKYAEEAIRLTNEANQYRPLGAGGVPLCLVAAGAVERDPTRLAKLEVMMHDWGSDFMSTSTRWPIMLRWCRQRLRMIRREARKTNPNLDNSTCHGIRDANDRFSEHQFRPGDTCYIF